MRCYSSETVIPAAEIPRLHPLLLERAKTMTQEYEKLESLVSNGAVDPDTMVKYSRVSSILEGYHEYLRDVEQAEELMDMASTEPDLELVQEAQSELASLVPQLTKTTTRLLGQLLPQLSYSDKPALLELRPGVGGSEAAIFTGDLLNMYINYASNNGWPYKLESVKRGVNNSVSEAILCIDHAGAYNRMRLELGVHRVQRIPATEVKGRVHTSTAAVVVLPKISAGDAKSLKEDERTFAAGEVRIDTMRAGGKGGQHVNTTDSAVRLTHIPTGLVVIQQDERSQPMNKAKAFLVLRARLAAREREREMAEQRKLRTDQVLTTDRSDKIRTYNYPQNRITDHRCGVSVYDIEGVMGGTRLDELMDKVEEWEFEEQLQALIASKGGSK